MSPRATSLPGSANGSGLSSTPSTIEKIAVVAPMPKASVSTAVSVNPGERASLLAAWRTSCTSRSSQVHPHASRDCSRMRNMFPKLLCPARAAISR